MVKGFCDFVRGLQGFDFNHCADPVWWRRDFSIFNNFLWKLFDDLILLKSDLSIISPMAKLENVIFFNHVIGAKYLGTADD
jgi:hypothetical protein